MNKEVGIYKIQNLINNKVYIGQSICISKRWNNHKSERRPDKIRLPLYRAFDKYGIENFSFEIIENCLASELDTKEKYWIAIYDSLLPNGYNIEAGGNSGHSNKMTEEIFDMVVDMLQNTSYSTEEIGYIVGISGSMVRAINRGDNWVKDGFQYPIRSKHIYRKLDEESKLKPIDENMLGEEHICLVCSAIFQSKSNKQKYCSQSCAHVAQMKIGYIPSRDELYNDLTQLKNFRALGRKYNVTDNTIKAWCRKRNLPDKIMFYIQNLNNVC